ncbi:VOC family protein [Desulfobacter vibrioformis]|uniref:VOC family protein n=1 Tax=Desulfobacter vibrioformis TaxID=34031 RepID=UPI000558250A|nr:VOC family protein [Desulfobacter vibrioformis]
MFKCCQIICRVKNIKEVVGDLEKAGFSVQWGSVPQKAKNAFLWFEHGPFIEFFSISPRWAYLSVPIGLFYGKAAGKRLAYWARHPEGWCDIALEPKKEKRGDNPDQCVAIQNDLESIKAAVTRAGIPTSRIIQGQRTRPDGLKVKFSFMATEPIGLPFLASPYDPPQHPEKIEHPNGATGIEWVKVAVEETHYDQFITLTQKDKWIKPELASQTRVLEVGLSGIKSELDAKYLHGAVFAVGSDNK